MMGLPKNMGASCKTLIHTYTGHMLHLYNLYICSSRLHIKKIKVPKYLDTLTLSQPEGGDYDRHIRLCLT